MTRETIISGDEENEEEDRSLRPQRMADMVGQRQVRERLQIAVDAAMKRGEQLGHILFDGPPGLGKTSPLNVIVRTKPTSLPSGSPAGRATRKFWTGRRSPKRLLPSSSTRSTDSVSSSSVFVHGTRILNPSPSV